MAEDRPQDETRRRLVKALERLGIGVRTLYEKPKRYDMT